MIWELVLNATLGMQCTHYHNGIPTGTIAFWGIHVLRILTVDYIFNLLSNLGGACTNIRIKHFQSIPKICDFHL